MHKLQQPQQLLQEHDEKAGFNNCRQKLYGKRSRIVLKNKLYSWQMNCTETMPPINTDAKRKRNAWTLWTDVSSAA
jgi:hypothetical protein